MLQPSTQLASVITRFKMTKKTVLARKKRGPPATGKGTLVGVRLLDGPLTAIDLWISQQNDPSVTRPEAIRRLVEIGLTHAPRSKTGRSKAAAKAKAKEMAEGTVEKLIAEDASPEERAVRKQRLIEGPRPLRDIRKSQR